MEGWLQNAHCVYARLARDATQTFRLQKARAVYFRVLRTIWFQWIVSETEAATILIYKRGPRARSP